MSDLTDKQRHVINLAADVIDAHTTNHKLANSLRGILQSLEARRTQPEATAQVAPEDITLESWDRHPRGGMQVGMPLGVKLTHKPTATIICVDSNRSQHRNKALAMEGLRAILAATQQKG